MKLKEFTAKTYIDKIGYIRPKIFCKDGFSMSVQGSFGHYSQPRSNESVFSEMEIGYPNKEEPLIMKYAENEGIPTETVYGYVPCDIIEKVIEKHGGIDIEKTFNSY